MKKQQLFDEEWDYAIVLDAARFDVFNEVYEDYLSGDLEKRLSPASATPEWVSKVFEGRKNVNYFSSNPFINSMGLSLSDTGIVEYDVTPSDHMTRIVDLWALEWDDELGTVLPEDVNDAFRKREAELPDRRTVIHYMQPHAPFLSRGKSRINMGIQKSFSNHGKNGIKHDLMQNISPLIEWMEKREFFMKWGLYTNLNLKSFLQVLRGDSSQKMLEFHEENMRKVLEATAELIQELDGKVVVTSDHGEAFGEGGIWGHHVEKDIPELVEVPWLRVEN